MFPPPFTVYIEGRKEKGDKICLFFTKLGIMRRVQQYKDKKLVILGIELEFLLNEKMVLDPRKDLRPLK